MATDSHGPIGILIVHHEKHIGQMWRDTVDYASNMRCLGVTTTITEARALAHELQPDILLIEAMDAEQGLQDIGYFREDFATTPVVVYLYDRQYKTSVEAAGIQHIICMPALLDEFPNVIRQAYHTRHLEENI